MKQFTLLLILVMPYISSGQFPEIKRQQERAISFQNVKAVLVYQYDYQGEAVDTTLLRLEKYNRSGKLTEKRHYSRLDTSSYSGVTYIYDATDHSLLQKPFEVNFPGYACPSYQGHPLKKIEKANDLGQLISVQEIRKEGVLEKSYSYDEKELLKEVIIKADKKLYWRYIVQYEYYD